MAGLNPYTSHKPKIPLRLMQFDDLYQAVQDLLLGYQVSQDMMILLPEERVDVVGRTLPAPVPNGIWAWNADASAPRYFTPEEFYALMPVEIDPTELRDLVSQAVTARNEASLFAAQSSNSAQTAYGYATAANGWANAAAASAASADTFKSVAQASATAAQSSANLSSEAATSASDSKDQAQAWAENPPDVEVSAGEYSAKHWATKAQQYAESYPTLMWGNMSGAITDQQDLIAYIDSRIEAIGGGGGSGGGGLVVSSAPPEYPTAGMRWLDDEGTEYTYVIDGDSGQWAQLGDPLVLGGLLVLDGGTY